MEKKIMKTIKSNALKALFVVALLCPAVFAEGEMGSGGFADPGATTKTVKTVRSPEEGEMGSGGRFADTDANETYLDSVLSSIYEYLDSMVR